MTKHEYVCQILKVVASKSVCQRKSVGAVFISEDFEILATGYNGPPRGFDDKCTENKCLINGHCFRAVHAEQNAIVQAAKRGTALKGSTLYCTYSPCLSCANMLANLGITKCWFIDEYDKAGLKVLKLAKIKTGRIK